MDEASSYSADYYRDRERAERELADQAASVAIRNIHLEMADCYRQLAHEGQLKQTGQDRGRLLSKDAFDLDGERARG